MARTGDPHPEGIFKMAEVVRNNGEYQINQILWLWSPFSRIVDASLMTFLALQFHDSNCKVVFVVVLVLNKGKIM